MNTSNLEMNILDKNIDDEYIYFNHNFLKHELENALNTVKEYIIDNDLMVVGGMAIDLALRVKDDNLYDENFQIPDYDIIDPDNVLHANNIGTILCNNKLTNIAVIPALHKTTVRVQMSGYTLFDATFTPEYIYNKIPYLHYKNIKFIDPIYQKIDQFMSLSFLFDLTGAQYNIQHRLVKDIKRKELLNTYYNLSCDIDISTCLKKNTLEYCLKDINYMCIQPIIKDLKKSKINLNLSLLNNTYINKLKIQNKENIIFDNTNISKDILHSFIQNNNNIYNDDIFYSIDCDITYHGELAYNLIYHAYKNMIKTIKSNELLNNDDNIYITNIEKNINIITDITIKDNILIIEHYDDLPLVFINNNNKIPDILNNIKKDYTIKNIKSYETIAHKIPNYTSGIIDIDNKSYDIQFFDLYGRMLSSNILEIEQNIFNIANYNYILSYFLFNYYYNDNNNNEKKQLYKSYYLSLLNIIKISDYLYNTYSKEINLLNINTSWFKYSINTLGFSNISENYYYFIKNFNYIVLNNKNLDDLPPKNYIGFPDCIIQKEFNERNSSYYNKFHNELKSTNYADELKELLQQY